MHQLGSGPFSRILTICIVAPLFAHCVSEAQPDHLASPSAPLPTAINGTQGLIKLDVVVTDASGKPVTGLKPQDFTLRDDGQPTKVITFQGVDGDAAKPEPPVEVILVLDELDLPPVQLSAAEKEAEKFLAENQEHRDLPVVIYRISQAGLSAEPSGGGVPDPALAVTRMAHWIWQTRNVAAGQEWRAGDGVFFSTDHSSLDTALLSDLPHSLIALGSIAIEERRKPGRKLLFWLGPGWPFSRNPGVNLFDLVTEMSTRLREARIDLWDATEWPLYDGHGQPLTNTANTELYQDFLDGVTSAKKLSFGNLALQVFATQSGGDVLNVRDDLGGAIEKRVEEASEYYTLTFDPVRTNEVDEYHDLKVDVDKPGLTAHTRSGYYDEPVFYDQPAAVEQVTVEQLEQILDKAHGSGDKKPLSGLELTERMSSMRLAKLKALVSSEKVRQELQALADESAFLPPPAADLVAAAPPDRAAQRVMLSRTVEYLNNTIARLPDFFAERTTVQFDEAARKQGQTWKTAAGDQSLHGSETSKATVLFRNGKEVVDVSAKKGRKQKEQARSLDTVGTFGPILAGVVGGAAAGPGDLTWSHWEQGANGPEAVFRYTVPQSTHLFQVGFCCLANDLEMEPFNRRPTFHGEIAFDPTSGAVLRLTADADLEARSPLERSGIMVEYGPVSIGGTTYICPIRSISLSRQRTVTVVHLWLENYKVYSPFETILDDVTFDKYHLFRSESRVLPEYTPVPPQN